MERSRRAPRPSKHNAEEPEASVLSVFVPDIPVDLSTTDAFGHRAYADAIAGILAEAPTPFTLGVFGDWGFGKTSIINEVRRQLEARRVAFVVFDVWRYEGDALRRQFLREVASQLKERHFIRSSYRPERELRDLEVDLSTPEQVLAFSWRGFVVSLIQGAFLGGLVYWFWTSRFPSEVLGITPAKGTPADVAGAAVAAATVLLGLLGQVIRVDQRIVALRRVEEPERFLIKFRELLAAVSVSRLVVAIDNLDRCSPELVDQLLATIKTYLDPTTTEEERKNVPEVLFMIAADENAIRRHMVARELDTRTPLITDTRSDDASDQEGDRRDDIARLREAERYVDEYLRKFFTATVQLKSMLDEEVREYALEQLTGFLKAHGLITESSDEGAPAQLTGEGQRLVSMVASALRKNPRRIKQFVNSLETKLRVIEARELDGKIDPPISRDILGIAKITIVEEEWRTHYEELEEDWRVLRQWHGELSTRHFDDPDFAAFLRTTRDIVPPELPAILNLKQSAEERDLPDLTRFREAVTLGDYAAARQIVESVNDDLRPRYQAKLEEMLLAESQADRTPEALNILEAALTDAALEPPESTRVAMLSYALNDADLARRLSDLDPHPLFALYPQLGAPERNVLSGAYVSISQLAGVAPDRARAAVQELAEVFATLPDVQRTRLRNEIATEPFSSTHVGIFLPLIERAPELLHDNSVDAAYERWARPDSDRDSPDFDLLTLGLGIGRASGRLPQVVSELVNLVQQQPPNVDVALNAVELVQRALDRLQQLDATLIGELATALNSPLALFVPEGDNKVPDAVLRVLYRLAEFDDAASAREAFRPAVTTLATTRPGLVAVAVAREAPAEPLPSLLIESLIGLIAPSSDETSREAAIDAVVALDPETGRSRVASQLTALIDQGHWATVAPIAVGNRAKLGAEFHSVVEALIGHARNAAYPVRIQMFEALSPVVSEMREADRSAIVELMVSMLSSADAPEVTAAANFITTADRPAWRKLGDEALNGALTRIAGAPHGSALAAALPLIADRWVELDVEARRLFVDSVAAWFTATPQFALQVVQPLGAFQGTAPERTTLVDAILVAEQQLDVSSRVELLFLAWQMRGGGERVTTKRLEARFDELRASSDSASEQVWAQLEPRLAAAG